MGVTTQFPDAAFFEGAIDLTALGLDECFTQFLAESRSSTSITASLQDFATPAEGFTLCNIDVTKNCTNPRLNAAQDAIIYDISGTVTATGNVSNVTLSDNPPADGAFQRVDCADPTMVIGPFPLASLNSGEVACYLNTITVPLGQNGLSDTVTATAETVTGVVLTDSTTAKCPNLQISPALSITKDCTSVFEVVDNQGVSQVVVKVNVSGTVCNTGDSNLSNVTVTDDKAGQLLVDRTSLTPNTCATFSGQYTASELPSAAGFTDTATATATDIFGDPVPKPGDPQQSDMAACCPLCPPPPSELTSAESARTLAPGTHTLTVISGSGDGSYEAGDQVTVTADARPGKEFKEWTKDHQILPNRFLKKTTATMPNRDVEITATYKDVPKK